MPLRGAARCWPLITSVQVETAVFPDCHFLKDAVENSERVTDSTIEDLYADGAYQSPENQTFAMFHSECQQMTIPNIYVRIKPPLFKVGSVTLLIEDIWIVLMELLKRL